MSLLARFLSHRDRAHPDVVGVAYPVKSSEQAALVADLRAKGVHAWADETGWVHAQWGAR